jgi:hypothetical protein
MRPGPARCRGGACPGRLRPPLPKISTEPNRSQDIDRISKKHTINWCAYTEEVEMSAADQYRRNASECVAITAFFTGPQQRAAILALAEAWTRLAEQAEKNEALLPATTGNEPLP